MEASIYSTFLLETLKGGAASGRKICFTWEEFYPMARN